MPSTRRQPRRILQAGLFGLLLASGCGLPHPAPLHSGVSAPAAPPAPPAPNIPHLVPGQELERTIAPGESHLYELDVEAGQYLAATLWSPASRVSLQLAGPDGGSIAEGGLTLRDEVRRLSAAGTAAGVHRLTVAAEPAAPASSYRLRVERRPAASNDAARVAAQRALSQALQERSSGTGGLERASTGLEAVLRQAREAGLPDLEAEALTGLGEVRYYQNQRPEALDRFEQARAVAHAHGLGWAEAYALNNLGVGLQEVGRSREAERAYREAVVRWDELSEWEQKADTLHNFGFLLLDEIGDVDQAAAAFREAVALGERLGSPLIRAKGLNGVGLAARKRGELDDALASFRRALELARAAGDGTLEAHVLRHIGSVHRRRGELQEALQVYLETLETGKGTAHTRSRIYHDLATVYVDLGDLETARASYEQVLALAPPEGFRTSIDALANLGFVLHHLGDPDGALARWQQALDLSRGQGYTLGEALARQNLGVLRREQGDLAAALAELTRARELWSSLHERPQEAKAFHELGTLYRRMAKPAEAAAAFDRALALAGGDPALLALCRSKRAELDRDEGRLAEARAGYEEALRAVESVRRLIGSDTLRTSYLAAKRPYYEGYIDVLARLDRLHPGQGYAEAALAASERARARGLLDLLAEGRVGVGRGLDPDLRQREAELNAELARTAERLTAAQAAGPADPERIAELGRHRLAVEQQLETLAGEIRRRNPRYAQVRHPAPLDARAVQAQLDPETLLLEYAVGTEASYLFAVARDGLVLVRLPPLAEIEGRVLALREALQATESQRRQLGRYTQAAAALYRDLIAPAGDLLRGRRRLLIVPDGPLHLLPFEVLLSGPAGQQGMQDLPYLLRQYVVTYAPSASVLAEFREPRPRAGAPGAKRLLAFGDPWYGAERSRTAEVRAGVGPHDLPALPESRQEVSRIARLYPAPEVALYLDRDASEQNVKANPLLASARTLHFATHGLIDEQLPLLSSLALARPEEGEEDGFLRTYEIFDLDLDADLVVLSACETGLGKQVSGEGLIGLSRAFFYAGASSLLVSLWNVAEVSTPDLMVSFYRQLESADKGEALRRAKLEMIAKGGAYAHPFYWSPFVLVGDSRSNP